MKPRARSHVALLCPVLCLALALGSPVACSHDGERVPREAEPLRVFAAASLTEVVTALAEHYDRPVATSFSASSSLARQIRDGAPADVFLSASPQWVDFLRQAGALDGGPVVLARNRLVAVAPRGSVLATAGVTDARSLLDRLTDDDGVAIADEGVPAGEYARAALLSLGLLDAFGPYLVGQSDVRAVLHAVEQGELRAGFVYATDAAVAGVDVLFAFDSTSHPAIEYQAAALRGAADPEAARAFVDFLVGDAARDVLLGAGFAPP